MDITPRHKAILNAERCPYCSSVTRRTTQMEVYGKTYTPNAIIVCTRWPQCDSYVGTHSDGSPLGRLANKRLRDSKKLAHKMFDELWIKQYMHRGEAYEWLSEQLDIPIDYTHIGMFGIDTCMKVCELSNAMLKEFENGN